MYKKINFTPLVVGSLFLLSYIYILFYPKGCIGLVFEGTIAIISFYYAIKYVEKNKMEKSTR